MKIEYLPVEGDNDYFMYAFYDESKVVILADEGELNPSLCG